MFITKMHLPRRTFLRGVGATLALPLLDSMIPARTLLAQTAARPMTRLGFVYVPHGAIMANWTPDAVGAGFEFKSILKPLEEYRSQLNIVTGLGHRAADTTAVHSLSPTTWLSGVRPAIIGRSRLMWRSLSIGASAATKSGRSSSPRLSKKSAFHAVSRSCSGAPIERANRCERASQCRSLDGVGIRDSNPRAARPAPGGSRSATMAA